jgi:cellulose synthase/poly-beta-1,6-N-acetylglucosamine synthase-like glycosyltransferase
MSAVRDFSVSLIVPCHNDREFLVRTWPAFRAAVSRHPRAELVIVDNGSTPPLDDLIPVSNSIRVVRTERTTIGAARNAGAARALGEFLVFSDADCVIEADHLVLAEEVLSRPTVDATGFPPLPQQDGNWVEDTWGRLHAAKQGVEEAKSHIPSGNFAITRVAYDAVGGFDEALVTGEDAELCERLRRSGYRLIFDPRLRAVHLGNPRNVASFFRRNVWHGLGTFGTTSFRSIDKPTAMLFAHLGLTGVSVVLAIVLESAAAIGWILLGQLAVPVVTLLYRIARSGSALPPSTWLRAVALYWLYYWARAYSLLLLMTGQSQYEGWNRARRNATASSKTPPPPSR